MNKILIFDIESSHNLGYFFDVWETNIPAENIVISSYIFCISYRWYGSNKVHTINIKDFPRFKKDIHDDTEVLKEFSKIVNQAEFLAGHNIVKFDIKKFNGRLLLKGLPPTKHNRTLDTLQMARREFKLDHNSLDSISKALGYAGKLDNPKGLWIKCFNGDVNALEHMGKYNRQDIKANTHIFERLMPFLKSAISKEVRCQNEICGSTDIQMRGVRGNSHSFQCNSCFRYGHIKIK